VQRAVDVERTPFIEPGKKSAIDAAYEPDAIVRTLEKAVGIVGLAWAAGDNEVDLAV
jgi:hypothetical protein